MGCLREEPRSRRVTSWGLWSALLSVLPLALAGCNAPATPPGGVSIQPATDPQRHQIRRNADWIEAQAMRLEQLLPVAYGVPAERLVVEADLPDGFYDVVVRTDDGEAAERLRQALEERFALESIDRAERQRVYVLETLPDREPRTASGLARTRRTSRLSFCDTRITDSALSPEGLATDLSQFLDRPVVDETHLDERFDVDLQWSSEDLRTLASELEEQTGLRLVAAERNVETVVVRPRSSRSPDPEQNPS